mgnify:CR=1 FL=1
MDKTSDFIRRIRDVVTVAKRDLAWLGLTRITLLRLQDHIERETRAFAKIGCAVVQTYHEKEREKVQQRIDDAINIFREFSGIILLSH